MHAASQACRQNSREGLPAAAGAAAHALTYSVIRRGKHRMAVGRQQSTAWHLEVLLEAHGQLTLDAARRKLILALWQ